MAYTKITRVTSTAEKSKTVVGRDRLSWRRANGRLFLFYGNNDHQLAIVEPDSKYPGVMWRVRFPDGRLSDMANLTRAKDAAVTCALRFLNSRVQETPSEAAHVRNTRKEEGKPQPTERYHTTRSRRLLSGLVKCGQCGSGYVIAGGDKRGRFLRCSRMIESGFCKNKRTVSLDTVEATVLHGIEMHLASPELVAEYVQEFYHALAELRGATENQCKKLSKRLHEIEQSIQIIVDLVVRGKSSRALMERLAELETERDATEVAMAEAEIAAPITLKPDAADNYRAKVRDLKAALAAADAENRAIAYAAIRELIDKVVSLRDRNF
jgi:hypothetical protein